MSGSAAAARAAGTRRTSATTNRIGGGNTETGARTGINIFYINCTAGIDQTFFDEKRQLILVVYFVVFFWLIQSQTQ